MDDNKVEYIPFHAINEFMLPDYRLHILQAVFSGLDNLSREHRSVISNTLKRSIKVPGFRNSQLAPAGVKARAAVTVFEQSPDFVAHVLQGWSELHAPLRQKVHDFLKAQDWEVLPPEADRSKLPGFLTEWPEGQDYDTLETGYNAMFPGETNEENDLRLMMVWIAGRLPYGMYEEVDEEEEAEE